MSKPILCLDTHELAWAAGFFDGEGHVALRRRGNWRELVLSVSQSGQSGRVILERMQRALGGLGKIGGPWIPKRANLPVYRLDMRGYVDVQASIALMWRWLSDVKRAQASAAMVNCRDYFARRSLMGDGPAKLTRQQVEDLRARYAVVKAGRKRAPRGFFTQESANLGLSINTLRPICHGRGYQ